MSQISSINKSSLQYPNLRIYYPKKTPNSFQSNFLKVFNSKNFNFSSYRGCADSTIFPWNDSGLKLENAISYAIEYPKSSDAKVLKAMDNHIKEYIRINLPKEWQNYISPHLNDYSEYGQEMINTILLEMIKSNVSIDIKSNKGLAINLLAYAIENNNLEMVKLLIRAGVNAPIINACIAPSGMSYYLKSRLLKDQAIFHLLKENGAMYSRGDKSLMDNI